MYKHDAIVRAWLDGKQIQVKAHGGGWREYAPGCGCVPAFHPSEVFRIKPEPKKTVGYKRFVFLDSLGKGRVSLVHQGAGPGFANVQWIDTEWQYEEFYE